MIIRQPHAVFNMTRAIHNNIIILHIITVQLSEHKDKEETQVNSKKIYLLILSGKEGTPTCINAWNLWFGTSLTGKEWDKIFSLTKQTVCDTRILDLQFKILH